MCTWCVHIESWGRFVTTSALCENCPYSELFWSAFFFASLRIQSKCEKIRTKITPNKDSFYAVLVHPEIPKGTVFDEVTLCNAGWLFLSCRIAKAIILSFTIKKGIQLTIECTFRFTKIITKVKMIGWIDKK